MEELFPVHPRRFELRDASTWEPILDVEMLFLSIDTHDRPSQGVHASVKIPLSHACLRILNLWIGTDEKWKGRTAIVRNEDGSKFLFDHSIVHAMEVDDEGLTIVFWCQEYEVI
jgi:hypothetical protein